MRAYIKGLRSSKKDFRIIPFGLVAFYILVLLFSEFYLGSYEVIGRFFRIDPIPYFVDLKILLCGIDAIRQHGDPYIVNCVDGFTFFNYPYAWGIFSVLPFITSSNLIYIGITLLLTLFTSLYFFIGKINFYESVIYSLLFVSPAVMLGVERGNCDLIIFLLLLIAIFYRKYPALFSFIILLTGMLKLFPISAITAIFNNAGNTFKKSLWLFVSIVTLFVIYLVLMKDNIAMVSNKTPRPYGAMCYGLGTIPSIFAAYYTNYAAVKIFIICILLMIFGFIIFYRYTRKTVDLLVIDQGKKGISYIIGACIFTLTCIIGYNWEYRLVFLLLTIPQILDWIHNKKLLATSFLYLTIPIVWQSLIKYVLAHLIGKQFYTYYNIIGELLVILLFYHHLAVLIKFLTNTSKKLLPFNLAQRKL